MSDAAPLVEVRGVVKWFEDGRIKALNGVNLSVQEGEFVAVVGPSGCGKSTLLHLIAALDRPTDGSVIVAGHDLANRDRLNEYRAHDVGIVFQLDNLLPTLSAIENVLVPMFESTLPAGRRRQRAAELLEAVGLTGKEKQRPAELSGGERQRVAVARALANDPPLLLADEPTGRLDSESGRRVLSLLADLRRSRGLTVILVTHEQGVAEAADRIVHMLDGRVVADGDTMAQSLETTSARRQD
jgi:ABC-type lipoprotein export system ATPase subunit